MTGPLVMSCGNGAPVVLVRILGRWRHRLGRGGRVGHGDGAPIAIFRTLRLGRDGRIGYGTDSGGRGVILGLHAVCISRRDGLVPGDDLREAPQNGSGRQTDQESENDAQEHAEDHDQDAQGLGVLRRGDTVGESENETDPFTRGYVNSICPIRAMRLCMR